MEYMELVEGEIDGDVRKRLIVMTSFRFAIQRRNAYRIFTFSSLRSVTHIGERSCSPAVGRGAEPSQRRTARMLLCAPLSAQLVAVRHRAVAALRAM